MFWQFPDENRTMSSAGVGFLRAVHHEWLACRREENLAKREPSRLRLHVVPPDGARQDFDYAVETLLTTLDAVSGGQSERLTAYLVVSRGKPEMPGRLELEVAGG